MRYRIDQCIPIEELKDGYVYKILARNASYGIWNEERKTFVISRFKFGMNYMFEEYHWDASETYGTAQPIEEVGKAPFSHTDINMELLNR